ncbi:uncharacterized protein C11orf97 homolog isoform X2 [Ascaphus truei]|uniref:uncharacterized protein C11orf97 homolog isoform X2 n=1 Tax=Ascaphus truei TaxID=8439 RepID=UPI003F59AF18
MRCSTECPVGSLTSGRHFFYVGAPKRIQQLTEEERFLQRDETQVTNTPSAMELEEIWSTGRDISMGSFNPTALLRNTFLTQPEHYSRHRVIRAHPTVSKNINKMHSMKDGVASKRRPSKPLTSKPSSTPFTSKDVEDEFHR